MLPMVPGFDEWMNLALAEEAARAGESVETYIGRAVASRMVVGRARRGDTDTQELLARVRSSNLDVPGPVVSSAADAVISNPDRLRALYDSGLLNTERAQSLDRIVAMVVAAVGVPSAAVTLVDRDTQYMCSAIGLAGAVAIARKGPLDGSLGREVVVSGRPLIIEDARQEPLLGDHLAVREGYVVAYAGFPLTDGQGQTIGALAAWDTRSRRWTSGHTQVMGDFVMMIRARIFGIALT
ncbi:GAF domain-containing protein [Mycolicibacterium rhodesiae NBB3]|uniref:GAF domain-containing protein n=1 Tax=Mycolicibacterium rhodesiae (strain NBB3) TaxID=710685 RepID=G8RRD8_MYCRN|nr:GAF domain-containing protein [Mycolicibacterium rhodesiae]AEV76441.1 GAF domain-containing protein [Mycolicibacterium rhodesiae NBB3]